MDDRYNNKYKDRDFDIEKLSEVYKSAKDNALKKEISDYSSMSPEVVAQLIRSWMNSEK